LGNRFVIALLSLLALWSPRYGQDGHVTLSGRVIDMTGAAVSGASVHVRDQSVAASKPERTATADAEGRFEIPWLSPGTYSLRVEGAGFTPHSQTINLGATQGEPMEIRLQAGNVFETVTITAQESGYQPLSATTGSRTDLPLRDIPASVQVVTRQVIDDQASVNVNDVVRNASGVNVPHSTGSRAEAFTIRGFTSTANTYRDGYRNDFNSNRSNTELSNVERVEVLKGPASILFGRLDPSGVINLVTKKPLSDSVISREQLTTQNPLNVQAALRYTAGVRPETYGYDNRGDWATLRGGSWNQYLNGLRMLFGSYNNIRPDPFTLERIDVLRCPSSVMYGQGGIGGVINLTSKRPLAQPRGEINVQFGNYNRKQLGFDLSGVADNDGKLLYRLIGLGRALGRDARRPQGLVEFRNRRRCDVRQERSGSHRPGGACVPVEPRPCALFQLLCVVSPAGRARFL
jgi:outer membrane receptor protein involved in Fe transport